MVIQLMRKPRPEVSEVPVSDQSAKKKHLGLGNVEYESPLNQKKGNNILYEKAVFHSQKFFLAGFVRLEEHKTSSLHSTHALSSKEKGVLTVLRKAILLFSLILELFFGKHF